MYYDTSYYTIVGTTMYVRAYFNYPMGPLYCMMVNVKKLVFMNDPWNLRQGFTCYLVLTKNIITLKLGNAFNNGIVLNKKITDITFGICFNRHLSLSKHVSILSFVRSSTSWVACGDFNQPLELSKNIHSLTLSALFNNVLVLPKNIKHLSLGDYFNKPFVPTKYLESVMYGSCYTQSSNLDDYMLSKKLRIETSFFNNQFIDGLPNNVQSIYFNCCCVDELNNLPNGVNEMSFQSRDDNPMQHLQSEMKKLWICVSVRQLGKYVKCGLRT